MSALVPSRPVLVDFGFLLALAVVATVGFADTFSGWTYLTVALLGWILGAGLAHVTNALAKPVVLTAALTMAVFFLLGGAVALRDNGPSGFFPLPGTLRELAGQSVHGWKDLLTTLAPVDGGPLLALPYLMGLVAGAGGLTVATRSRSPLAAVALPTGYLAAVILLGVQSPDRVLVIGALFAVLALTWIAVRGRRFQRRTLVGSLRLRRRVLGAAMVGGAGLLATVIGPQLPLVHSTQRTVLRNYVTPPFDVGHYPSPLVSFRQYTRKFRNPDPDKRLYDKTLMTVSGLPRGTRLRFATLDSYNGTVWGASNQAPGTTGPAGSFRRVGSDIRESVGGATVTATVKIAKDYAGNVWLPIAGHLSEIHFGADDQQATFRYNLETGTGVMPQGIAAGDRYTFVAHLDPGTVKPTAEAGTSGMSTVESSIDFVPVASRWGGTSQSAMRQVLEIASYLKSQGAYTDGESPNQRYTAGHSEARLALFSKEGEQMAGNDEQYAAMLAILANQVGAPARVVLGAVVPSNGTVKGADVHAWLELQDVDGNWRTLPTEAFMDNTREPKDRPPVPQQLVSGQVVPPPAPVAPPATVGEAFDDGAARKGDRTAEPRGGWAIPAWLAAILKYVASPLLAVALLLMVIVALKTRRRRHRRTRGAPAVQLAAGWRELLDSARDLGVPVHARMTRREQAHAIGHDQVAVLARRADAHVFGASTPTEGDSAAFWKEIDAARKQLVSDLSRWRRLRAAASLASFRPMTRAEPTA